MPWVMEGIRFELGRRCWPYLRDNERNLMAATFHFISLLSMAGALLSMNWFHIWARGHFCQSDFNLGLYHLLEPLPPPIPPTPEEELLNSNLLETKECRRSQYLTGDVRRLMKFLIGLCILCMSFSVVGLCLDLLGSNKSSLWFLRRNALPSILAVVGVLSIIGVAYYASASLEQAVTNLRGTSIARVTYGSGYYTVPVAGFVSILATACDIFRYSPVPMGPLEEDVEGSERILVDGQRSRCPTPPPPYTP